MQRAALSLIMGAMMAASMPVMAASPGTKTATSMPIGSESSLKASQDLKWSVRSQSEVMGTAIAKALLVVPSGKVLSIKSGCLNRLAVWNIDVRTPAGVFLVAVDKSTERVVATTKIR